MSDWAELAWLGVLLAPGRVPTLRSLWLRPAAYG